MFDVLVVGGGINGAGIARDAAGRGLRVALCEQHDLAAHTSSASSKLIHGGLRYLETGHFGMVRRSLQEREVLLRIAPHLVQPLAFVVPHVPHLRPAWLIHIGLWLYDRIGGRSSSLPRSRGLSLHGHALGAPLRGPPSRGFVYADAQVPDARLVIANAVDAAERGAQVWTRTRCVQAWRQPDGWTLDLVRSDGTLHSVQARALVNATGPWAGTFTADISLTAGPVLRLVQGSHIVVPALFDHDHGYLLQQPDGRVVFALPFEQDYTLVGTTDVEFEGDPAGVSIDAAQLDYLCEAVNRGFARPISQQDVLWSFSGVRPLVDEPEAIASRVPRDYQLQLDAQGAPLLNVIGGKLTTYRRLAEEAVNAIGAAIGRPDGAWTATGSPLPGGELGLSAAVETWLRDRWPWLPQRVTRRWARSLGTRAGWIVQGAQSLDALGEHFGAGLYEAELRYLQQHEWARTAEDVLWRRTWLGLQLDTRQQARVADWFVTQGAAGRQGRSVDGHRHE